MRAVLSTVAFIFLMAHAKADEFEMKRRSEATDEELRKQLIQVPEFGLDQPKALFLYQSLNLALTKGVTLPAGKKNIVPLTPAVPDVGPRFAAQLNASMKTLPWRSDLDCQLGREAAESLHALSLKLRAYLRDATPADDIRPDPDKLRSVLNGSSIGRVGSKGKAEEWKKPDAVPALMQLLQAENLAIRQVLVEALTQIEGKEAGAALAQRAVFDLSFPIRKKAVEALTTRPTQEYQKTLLDALRYPWSPVASNAAEALATLKPQAAVEGLILMLKEPDPRHPFSDKQTTSIRELVKINHLSNCMVCHAPSLAKDDLVRGNVPIPGQEPPKVYYQTQNGIFVRADTTFLKQDFSVMQPVINSGTWRGNQRFDYLVRTRSATATEILRAKGKDSQTGQEYADAVHFALKAITGRDEGKTYESWQPLLRAIQKQ